MPGIVGYVTEQAECRPDGFIEEMASALEGETTHYRVESFHDPNAGLGKVTFKPLLGSPQPVWNADRTVCLVMEGQVNDVAAGAGATASPDGIGNASSQAELLLRLYEAFGDDFGVRVNGAFVAAVWDSKSRRLTVTNDHLGLFPVYYTRFGGTLLFGSAVRALLADPNVPRRTDRLAIAQFLTFDHLLDDRTLLAAVRLLPQASVLTFCQGKLQIRPYWRLEYPSHFEPRGEVELRQEFLSRFHRAVERHTPAEGPAGLLLSGGLDSRFILAELCSLRDPSSIHTFTWGIPNCDDARIARELSQLAGTKHHFFELEPDYLLRTAEDAVRITDGLGNIVNLHALAIVEQVSQFVNVIQKGFLGDAMFGFALQRPFWAQYDEPAGTDVHLSVHNYQGVLNYTHDQLDQLCTDAFNREIGTAVIDSYREGMERSDSDSLGVQRLYFDLTQRVPRMTLNGVEVARSRLSVRLPFADTELLKFSLTVPPGYLFERYIVRTAFQEAFPGFAKVPVSDTGLPMVSCARDVYLRGRQIVRWHMNNSGIRWLHRPDRRPYKDYGRWFRTVLRPWLEDLLLSPGSLERGYFQPDQVRRLVSEHLNGSSDHTIRLGALLTLELWHRQFID